jgi:hypothetical protein
MGRNGGCVFNPERRRVILIVYIDYISGIAVRNNLKVASRNLHLS